MMKDIFILSGLLGTTVGTIIYESCKYGKYFSDNVKRERNDNKKSKIRYTRCKVTRTLTHEEYEAL